MKLRDRFSNYLYSKLEKRMKSFPGGSVKFPFINANEDNILRSSDVYELMQDISNQLMLASIVIEDRDGNEIRYDPVLQILRNPNNYLTQSEFIKLMTNTYLLQGEVFPVLDGDQLHLPSNIYTELDDHLVEHFKSGSTKIPGHMIRHIKNIGNNHLKGVGILDLGKETLQGVMSAEKVLTDKYTKGGLLAFMLKLDAHINPQNGAQSKLIKAILDQLEDIDDSRSVKMIPLGKGYNIETMKSPVDDDKTLDYLNVYKKDLGKYLNINVETYQKLIQSDLEKAMMYLHNKAIKPIIKNFEDHLSLLFFGSKSDKRIKFKVNVLDFVSYSTKTNIAYNVVRTGITTPDMVADNFLGLPTQDTEESQALYISNDLSRIGEENATDDPKEFKSNKYDDSDKDEKDDISSVSLNGAQIQGVLDIVSAVVNKEMEYDAAITLLVSSFPFNRVTAKEILGNPDNLVSDDSDGSKGGDDND